MDLSYVRRNGVTHKEQENANIDPPPAQPVPPELFYGRDELVSALAARLFTPVQQRIAILGAGGLGKTTVALHVLYHADVVKRHGERCFYVGCDGVRSANALALRILRIMQAPIPTNGSPIDALRSALEGSSQTLLLLDNFESIWDIQGDQDANRKLLTSIASVMKVSLIITMRATDPPVEIQWTFADNLPPLSPSSARDVFLTVHPKFTDGSYENEKILTELLEELDHVPLAIHLLAQVSRGFQPKFTLKRWRERRTQMLRLATGKRELDRLESVDVSVSLSITSLDGPNNPGAIQLLAMLCLLPDGLFWWQERLEMMEKTFDSTFFDLSLLQRFALVHLSGDKLGVLSPIRHFVLQHHPPDEEHVKCIANVFWQLIGTYAVVDYGPEFIGAVQALGPEIGNIVNLIDHAVRYSPSEQVLHVAIDMSWYFNRTHPSTDLLDKISALIPTADPGTQARFWEISGEIAYYQNRYENATSSYTLARDIFLKTNNRCRVAHCTYRLGDILRLQDHNSEATLMLTHARDQFMAFNNHIGHAKCLRGLGDILRVQSRCSEAAAMYNEARREFVKMDDRFGAALCLKGLGDVLRMQSNYSEASSMLMEAHAEFLEIGASISATKCVQSSGYVFLAQARYEEASIVLKEAHAEFLKIGEPLSAAQCLESLGDILLAQERYSDASYTLTEARDSYIKIGDRYGEAGCRWSLGDISLAQGNRAEAESSLTKARDLYLEIGQEDYANDCSWLLENHDGSEDNHSKGIVLEPPVPPI
ncbi:hypothetical protein HWV62_18094 [Athelia sp. TMB]|nr:hypothetical protein HWV62_18094 [Athelia sp. TMB]